MFGISGIIKLVLALIIILVIGGGMWYVTGLRADLAISQENNKKLEAGIITQQQLMDQMRADIELIQKTNTELQAAYEKQKQDVATLTSKFSKRDFGALAFEKPKVVERLINRGTQNAMRCFELASGAPLNEKEKTAKTPTEANRECPSLIDGNYTSVVN